MSYLIITTFIWAFSFSLIGEFLSGKVDVYFSILIRVILALGVFLPFTNWKIIRANKKLSIQLMMIGALQIGLMYLAFYNSFKFLSVPEVLVFTIFTPIYVSIISDLSKKKFNFKYLLSSIIAVIGAFIIRMDTISSDYLTGFILIQTANICFASGQVFYKNAMNKHEEIDQKEVFSMFFFGALIISLITFYFLGSIPSEINAVQSGVLIWLGLIASGFAYFLWNNGATRVNSGILASMNNAVIPIGLIINLIFWNKNTDLLKLSIGATIILIGVLISTNSLFRLRGSKA